MGMVSPDDGIALAVSLRSSADSNGPLTADKTAVAIAPVAKSRLEIGIDRLHKDRVVVQKAYLSSRPQLKKIAGFGQIRGNPVSNIWRSDYDLHCICTAPNNGFATGY
jgi:hypothetical protein